jgi:hypothetical protein
MRAAALLLAAVLCACTQPLPVSHFAGEIPAFDPVRFFTGHVRSWGVLENRSGAPTGTLTTDCQGTVEPDGSLHMVQHIAFSDGTAELRDWHMRRTAPGRFEATATGMVGTGHGEVAGRALNLRWALATQPGDPLANVWMDQWMYLMDGGTMVNRTTISKLGVVVAEVTEGFEKVP